LLFGLKLTEIRSAAISRRSYGRDALTRPEGYVMGAHIQPSIVRFRITAKWRKFGAIVTYALAIPLLSKSEPALAQCSGNPDNVTCTMSGNPYDATVAGNPFQTSAGINVGGGPADTLSLTLQQDVKIVLPSGGTGANVANATGSNSPPFASATLTANNASVNNIGSPGTSNNTGLRIQSAGAATITASGNIDVLGTASDHAILAIIEGSDAPPFPSENVAVTYTGQHLTSSGANSTVIQADNRGFGNASIYATGNLTGVNGTFGQFIFGLDAVAGDTEAEVNGTGDALVRYSNGTITVSGQYAVGIFASSGLGSATVETSSDTTIIVNALDPDLGQEFPIKPGIDAESGGASQDGSKVTEAVASTIKIFGKAAPESTYSTNPVGIRALSFVDAPITITYTGTDPGIMTQGGGGIGILALSESLGEGNGAITVNSSGPINTTNGVNAVGILADSGTILNFHDGDQTATATGLVQVTASNVSTPGQFGVGISATGGSGGVAVNIPSGGSITGGWQADVSSVGVTYGLPAAGVILGSSAGSATLTNDGSIGALSDRAVASPPPTFHGDLGSPAFPTSNNTTIINNGTITGFVQLVGGNNSIDNNGTFNLRHFADTTGATDNSGNGVRDTVRVAVANLGTGPNNSFTNNGTLALAPVTGATHLDNTGEYLPVANSSLGNTSNAMAIGGPVQGQIIGAATFTNSGTINLQSNPAPGDVLIITDPAATPASGRLAVGPGGVGTYVSNGGSLLLDTVLNEGGMATRSDTLVVDGTSVGAGSATKINIHDAGGTPKLTVGDGILVVEVLNQSRSATGAFTLANGPIEAGPFEYELFHGGLPGTGSNPGDWFLRNVMTPEPPIPPGPTPPEPPNPLPPTPPPNPLPPDVLLPIIGPDLATDGVVQPLARQLGLTTLGTLHERVGDTYAPDCSVSPAPATSGVDLPTKKPAALPTKKPGPAPCPLFSPSAWARFFGGTTNNQYQAFADPRTHGNFWGFQGGVDLLRGSSIAGRYDRVGLYGAYGNTNDNVDGLVTNPAATAYILTHTGSVNLDAWSGGAYWTHVGPGGWYLDAVLQGTVYTGHAATPQSSLTTDGTGFIASLEAGYPIPLWFWPRLVLEPQGQILWQHVGFNHEFDGFQNINLGSTNGPTGRLGLLAESTIVTDSGQVWQPYVRGNVWESWGARATTTFGASPIQVSLLEQATWLEFAGGGTVKVNANWSAYAQAGYQFAVAPSNVRRNGFTGDVGLRYTW
jgi:hypothetical protein